MGQLQNLEPIALPDVRQPARMPSLPAWLASRKSALATNLQRDPATGGFREMLTLPATLLPSEAQRQAMMEHLRALRSWLETTPERDRKHSDETLATVTKLLLTLPAPRADERAVEAKGDAYMAALDDVPSWAVAEAVRCWYRGDCGTDDRGRAHDYTWAPVPAVLRRIALGKTAPVRQRIAEIERILSAVEYVDCSAEFERGRRAMRGLHQTMGDAEALRELTFERAVEIGALHPNQQTRGDKTNASQHV